MSLTKLKSLRQISKLITYILMKIRKENRRLSRDYGVADTQVWGETQCQSSIDRWSARALLIPSHFTPCCRLNVDIIVYASTIIKTFYQPEITFNDKLKLFVFVTCPHICPSPIKYQDCFWTKFQIDIRRYDTSEIEIIF